MQYDALFLTPINTLSIEMDRTEYRIIHFCMKIAFYTHDNSLINVIKPKQLLIDPNFTNKSAPNFSPPQPLVTNFWS